MYVCICVCVYINICVCVYNVCIAQHNQHTYYRSTQADLIGSLQSPIYLSIYPSISIESSPVPVPVPVPVPFAFPLLQWRLCCCC